MRFRRCVMLLGAGFLLASPASAQRLPRTATPEHYDLAFTVDLAGRRFDGVETIRVTIDNPTARIVLNAAELAFSSATIVSGSASQPATVALDAKSDTATLTIARALPRGEAEIHVRYAGTLNDQLRGFYLSKGGNRPYAVSQFESTDARRAFPCFDEPAYKATFDIALTVDRSDMAISNGRVIADTPGPGAGRHTVRFSTSPKMSTYLVALAVGDFACLSGSAGTVPIRVCAPPDKKELGHLALESAQYVMRYYNGYFTQPYPFDKLDMLAVPDFAAGAMENTAAIFYRESDLLADSATASVATRKNVASIVAHEMAHQWFGDLVTMKWWDDLWLNEGFATWMSSRPLAAWKPEWNIPVDDAVDTQSALNLDSLRSTRPVRAAVETPSEIDAAFDDVAYQKGAAILRMIEGYVGDEPFRRGINAYLQAHAYGTATSEDFWRAIATASGKPVDRILPTFLEQPGVPLVEVSSLTCGTGGASARAMLTQSRFLLDTTRPPADTGTRWRIPMCLKTGASSTAAASCPVVSQGRQTIEMGTGCPSWLFANVGAEGYYRTAYTPELLRALAPHVGDLTAPERLALADDEWALVRSRRHSAADYLTLASGYGRESSSGVLAEITGRLSFIDDYLTTDATRMPMAGFVRSLLRPLFDRLGFTPTSSDTDDRRALRAVLVSALGTMGNDDQIVRQSRSLLDRALAGGAALDPSLASSIVAVAAAHGDAALYDALSSAAMRGDSTDARTLYFNAGASFRDPAIIDRALQRATSTDVRTQDTARYLSAFLENPVARPRAWAFVKANWTVLEPKLSVFNAGVTLVNGLASFCDDSARDDVQAFFSTHRLPGTTRAIDQAVERINNCIDLRGRDTQLVGDWLNARR